MNEECKALLDGRKFMNYDSEISFVFNRMSLEDSARHLKLTAKQNRSRLLQAEEKTI